MAFILADSSLGVYVKEGDENVINTLIETLSGLQYDGKKVFKRILRKEEAYSGPFVQSAPDILLIPNGFFIGASLKGEIFEKFESHHDMHGIFLAYGSNIKEGYKLKNVKIYDIAPTILHIFNLSIPRDMDGRVIKEMFKEGSGPAVRPVKYSTSEKGRMRKKISKLKKR